MSDHAALDAEYKRVIPAKFVTRRDGSPMHCMACAADLVMGQAFAATPGDGAWHSYCSTCANSPQAQVGGLVTRVEALVEALDDPSTVQAHAARIAPVIQTALTTGDKAAFLEAKAGLVGLRAAIGLLRQEAKAAAVAADPLLPALQAVAADPNRTQRDRDFAASLAGQLERKGALSDKQMPYARKLTAGSEVTNAPQVENGLYLHDDGTIHKLYTTQNDRQACKVLKVTTTLVGEYEVTEKKVGSFEYVKGGVRVVREAVAAGTARLLTQDEASEFGKQHGFCVNCALDLTDDRSLAVGYGPVCAARYDWWYPTQAEAILNRPTEVAPMFEAIGYLTPDEILGMDES